MAVTLIALDVCLTMIYLTEVLLGMPSWTLHQLVNLDAEATVAAWYTSAKLLIAGVLFLLLAYETAGEVNATSIAYVSRRGLDAVGSRRFLVTVGLALVFLSLDETSSLHELMTRSLRRFESLPRFTGDHGMWIPFLLAGVVWFLVATGPSWSRLWRTARTGTLFMGAGLGVGMTGAVGLEILSYEVIRPAGAQTLYVLEVALEECLEMLGATLLLIGSAAVYRTGTMPMVRRAIAS